MNDKIKILIADDHPLMRKGLVMVLGEEKNKFLVEQAEDGEEAYKKLNEKDYDVVTLDIEMPGLNGLELARKLSEDNNSANIIFLTMYKEEDMFNEAMDAGARGYVLKENAVIDIVDCINEVKKGGYYISPLISQYLVKRVNQLNNLEEKTPTIKSLTKSERKILKLVSEDKTTKEIAIELFISPKTVENHRNNISKKLNLQGSHSLVKFAFQNKSIL